MDVAKEQLELFARCARGFEAVLADELRSLGIQRVRPLKGGVAFFGGMEDAYRACLWSHVATRIQLVLTRVAAASADELYTQVAAFAWEKELAVGATIAVHAHGENKNLRNSQFTALKVKDALCDRLRNVCGMRPSVNTKDPDFALDLSLHKDRATLYLNLSGPSLHMRGYRKDGVQTKAPLKETLAAGMLLAAGWQNLVDGFMQTCGMETPEVLTDTVSDSIAFVDPLCGSGTLAIEAALLVADIAPGMLRTRWGFVGWAQHSEELWARLYAEAERRKAAGLARARKRLRLLAGDYNPRAIAIAQANAQRAGVLELIDFYVADAGELFAMSSGHMGSAGLLATNPPYGQRMLDVGQLDRVYQPLRRAIETLPAAWSLAIITPDESVDSALREVASRILSCYNGPLETKLRFYENRSERMQCPLVSLVGHERLIPIAEAGSEQFAARLRKVAKERAKWARKEGISCYRIYDADLPDYALSVDMYQETQTGRHFVRLVEYQAPASIDPLLADRRFMDAQAIVPAVLDVDQTQVFAKVRKRAKGGSQYREARAESKVLKVQESGFSFEVDLNGYLDTGLFLDHRITRSMLGTLAAGKRFLNLFAYTGSASVYAAGGGALATTTVDLSNTYLAWAQRNMAANGFVGPEFSFVRANVMEWLKQAARNKQAYDLVFCDPPTFSNSKSVAESFDVQRDHVKLLLAVKEVLAPGGTIVFSNNLRGFKIDKETLDAGGLEVNNITPETIPHDFARTPKIHHCFNIGMA